MASQSAQTLDDGFTPPGIIRVSTSALQLARDFAQVIHTRSGDWVAVFDWATDVTVRRGPKEPSEAIADCVMLGASQRHEVPREAIQAVNGLEFAIQIPKNIWETATQRLIDTDESIFFKLVLR